MKNKHTYNIGAFILAYVIITICSLIVFTTTNLKTVLYEDIISSWQRQARTTLNTVRNQFNHEVSVGAIDPYDEASVGSWAEVYISGLRNGGITSDAFLIDLKTGKFIWDSSPDCASEGVSDRFIFDEAPKHNNPTLANKVLEEMLRGYDTEQGTNRYWLFDDSREYLEWVILPSSDHGFDGKPAVIEGIVNKDHQSYILVLGTQEDEIYNSFIHSAKKIDFMQHLSSLLSILIFAVSLFLMIKNSLQED